MKRSIVTSAPRHRTAGFLLLSLLLWSAAGAVPLAAQTPDSQGAPEGRWPSYGRLLLGDLQDTVGAPLHWQTREWELFSLSVAGIGVVSLADGRVRDSERHNHSAFADNISRDFEPLGAGGAFGVLGAFYLESLVRHDDRARAVAEDGLAASLIAGGLITPAVKYVAGRNRPRDAARTYDFKPFSGQSSFPSGHTTEAFAVASVVAYEYDSPWVKTLAYGSATLVGYARIHHQAHFLSDVTAGALIGTVVGHTVAARNHERRYHLAFVPVAGPRQETGVGAVLSF
jgi:hypothetical protein